MSDPYRLSSGRIKLEITPKKNNSICVSKFNNCWVDTLGLNDTIGINSVWSDSTVLFYSYNWGHVGYTNIEGLWFNLNRSYFGFKIDLEDHQFYGWVKKDGLVLKQCAITSPFKEQQLVNN